VTPGRLDFAIDVPVTSDWPNVEHLRSSVDRMIRLIAGDAAAGQTVSLVAAELAENAIKYGAWREDAGTLRVRVWGDYPHAHVMVESPVGTGDEVPEGLSRTLSFISAYPSALEAYQAKIAERADSSDGAASGLGLLRVSYEAGCTLRAEVEGATLRIVADMEL
jgi:hypothetical protein